MNPNNNKSKHYNETSLVMCNNNSNSQQRRKNDNTNGQQHQQATTKLYYYRRFVTDPEQRIPYKLPLPIGIELYNLFWIPSSTISSKDPNSNSNNNTIKKKWRYRREYKSDLLHRVQLEISILQDDVYSNSNEAATTTSKLKNIRRKRRLLYKEICTLPPTINPSWRHLNESIGIATNTISTNEQYTIQQQQQNQYYDDYSSSSMKDATIPVISYDTLTIDEYNSMIARISIVLPNNEMLHNNDVDDTSNTNKHRNNNTTNGVESYINTNQVSVVQKNPQQKQSYPPKAVSTTLSQRRIRTESYEFYNNSSDYWDTSHNYDDPSILFQQQHPTTTPTPILQSIQQHQTEEEQQADGYKQQPTNYDNDDTILQSYENNNDNDINDESVNNTSSSITIGALHEHDEIQEQQDQELSIHSIINNNHTTTNTHVQPPATIVSKYGTGTAGNDNNNNNNNVVVEVPIHPSKLIKIGKVPPNLPLNCIVVYYSDGTIRVQPIHYQRLYDSKQYGVVVDPITSILPSSITTTTTTTTPVPNATTTTATNTTTSIRKITKLSLSQQSSFDGTNNNGCVSDDASTNTTVINFDDDAFAALDAVAPPPRKTNNNTIGIMIDDDLFPDVLLSSTTTRNEPYNIANNKLYNNNNKNNKEISSNGHINTNLLHDSSTTTPHGEYNRTSNNDQIIRGVDNYCSDDEDDNDRGDDLNDISAIVSPDEDSSDDVFPNELNGNRLDEPLDPELERLLHEEEQKQILFEQQRLQKLLQEEEYQLENEMKQLQIQQQTIQNLLSDIQLLEHRTNVIIPEEITNERIVQKQYEFLVESQRIRLIIELSTIYPITVVAPDRRYLIRGIEIPRMEAGFSLSNITFPVSDDDLSAALGFLCQVIVTMSLYLNVHLRYKIICYSSRSAIIDMNTQSLLSSTTTSTTNNTTNTGTGPLRPIDYYTAGQYYPLFYGRGVEKERFECAIYLLNCNVDCLCRSRSIRISLNAHILAKMKRIYENVIEGY